MNLPRSRPSYLSLKRALETSKYQLEYQKSKVKHLTPTNRIKLTSNRHSRKNSELDLRASKLIDVADSSVIIYSETKTNLEGSINTCIVSPTPLIPFDSDLIKYTNPSIVTELDQLKSEIEGLKEDIWQVKNAVACSRILKKPTESSDSNKENQNNIKMFNKLQEKLRILKTMNPNNL